MLLQWGWIRILCFTNRICKANYACINSFNGFDKLTVNKQMIEYSKINGKKVLFANVLAHDFKVISKFKVLFSILVL